MKSSKKNAGVVLLIIVLALIIISLAGFIVYDKIIIKEGARTEEKNTKKISISDEEVKKIMNIVDIIPEYNGLTVEELNKISNKDKFDLAVAIIGKQSKTYSGKDLKQALIDVFGSDIGFTLSDIICADDNTAIYKYNKDTDTFNHDELHAHGMDMILSTYNFNVSYDFDGNKVRINVKKLFDGSDGMVPMPLMSYYTNLADAKSRKNERVLYESMTFDETPTDGEIEKLKQKLYNYEKDSLPVYTYNFEKVNDKFLFKSYTIEEQKSLEKSDEKCYYTSVDQIISSKKTNNDEDSKLRDKYTVIDINNDGYKEVIYASVVDKLDYKYEVYRGSKNGYKYVEVIAQIHNDHGGVKKESGKDYLYLNTSHMGSETIWHYYLTDKPYKKEISNTSGNETYHSDTVEDEIIWFAA